MNILLQILSHPEHMAKISEQEWDELLRRARNSRLLAHLHAQTEKLGIFEHIPVPARQLLLGDSVRTDFLQLHAKKELKKISKALENEDYPIILLKGAAYIESGLTPAAGRRLSDIDILVAKPKLQQIEDRLLSSGWETEDNSEYDQHYYREWMHEIPPLHHPQRNIEVDIHHNLTPPTSRYHPDSGLLLDDIVKIPNSFYYRLSDTDILLHSATHLFFNDELRGGLRDVVDMHHLCLEFGQNSNFWEQLPGRAIALNLGRPLFYALDTLRRLLNTPIPSDVFEKLKPVTPNLLIQKLMAALIDRLIAPNNIESMQAPTVQWLLFVRSHWVRMPPLMLLKHLSYKARFRLNKNKASVTRN